MIQPGTVVEFNRKKQFKHVKPLGTGGTGDTHLFLDETTDILFAFKKYSPKGSNEIEENYHRFVDEIKILFNISHPNIVRVYNYYLYPEQYLGYLQMEYIEGVSISEYTPNDFSEWEIIFKSLIGAFEYLENNKILHRDIRPANIMIDQNKNLKIIDFGFGKKLEIDETDGKSILLNWPVSNFPDEVINEHKYNNQTEIFFLGKLIQNILNENLVEFKFKHIVENMIKVNPLDRYKSFEEINLEISRGVISEINFPEMEKQIYQSFAQELNSIVISFNNEYNPIKDNKIILEKLENVIRSNSLEQYIQNNGELAGCFVDGGFTYSTAPKILFKTALDFYTLLNKYDDYKRKLIIDNIFTRLSQIKVEKYLDDLPF